MRSLPDQANLYIAYALAGSSKLPNRFVSYAPWDGTLPLLKLGRELDEMHDSRLRSEIDRFLNPSPNEVQPTASTCFSSVTPMTHTALTPHFYVEYIEPWVNLNADGLDGAYLTSLETTWQKEITEFGWVAPPSRSNAPPGGRYHVRIDSLGPGLYGFVSSGGTYAGSVGNNPNSSWNDVDAFASCMVLNDDYTTFAPFGSAPQSALDSTTAHEFNHSIQFGIGALNGPNVPDDVFIEGGATWIEDEAQDGANDNYNFLWPTFEESMGAYPDSPYSYWITFRGITERFGTGVAGGGEQIMQDFWEITSKNQGSNLAALNTALAARLTTLAAAYNDYAIAAPFMKSCGGGYTLPYCFEEAAGYVAQSQLFGILTNGLPPVTESIVSIGESYSGNVLDNYALNWISLPSGTYNVIVTKNASGGSFNVTLVCDTGSTLTRQVVTTGMTSGSVSAAFNGTGCSRRIAVITNTSQSAPNPSSSAQRAYTIQVN